jgi:PHD/YefM family antitoxin component YafN of YafNO toxin-antitoxin module
MEHVRVFTMLSKGPVVLAQRSKPTAVLVSVADWDSMAGELARLRRIVEADRQFAEIRAGKFIELEHLDTALAGN